MTDPILSPGDPEPKRGRSSRAAWIRRPLPEDPSDRVLFLFERMNHVWKLFIMGDLTHLHYALREARPSPTLLRHWRKEFANARSNAQITCLILREAWCEAAREPSRRRWVKKKAADDAWLQRQLGTLEGPK